MRVKGRTETSAARVGKPRTELEGLDLDLKSQGMADLDQENLQSEF